MEKSTITVKEMFPENRLAALKVSDNVLAMTPADLEDMGRALSLSGEGVENPHIRALTARDIQSVNDLFEPWRQTLIANYDGLDSLNRISDLAAEDSGSTCCCCCTPCCSCCCAATEIDPFRE